MRKVLVKIDLCGSKEYVDMQSEIDPDARRDLLKKLVNTASLFFPDAIDNYPEGSLYNPQGDAIFIILDRPTVALRCAIEFQKEWSGNVPDLPDCRIVIDIGDLTEHTVAKQTELLGAPFENITIMEKKFGPGSIGVTRAFIRSRMDTTLVQFLPKGTVRITSNRVVDIFRVNYEDPRLVADSSLAHALFIADPAGQAIRNRTFETLMLECLLDSDQPELSLDKFNNWMLERNCPELTPSTLSEIATHSPYLKLKEPDKIIISKKMLTKLENIKKDFDNARLEAVESVAETLSKKVRVDSNILQAEIDISALIEEYLCAVFLEIRMMANYFRSTRTLFERLSENSEFDYVIRRRMLMFSGKPEQFAFSKKIFLDALRKLASTNNKYIAAIFHNVLMLYYLNRNPRFAHNELASLQAKEIYLDTNTFYAFRCMAASFHEIVSFSLERLIKLGTSVRIFDCSVEEYNESLDSTLHKYSTDRDIRHIWRHDWAPWIWLEYIKSRDKYSNSFSFCVAVHRMPPNEKPNVPLNLSRAEKDLKALGITMIELTPFKDRKALGDLYNYVFSAKDRPEVDTTSDSFHKRVMHDANCLDFLQHQDATNPYTSQKVFVTCDYALTKVRKRCSGQYEYLVTAPEFYEFMLPYLFLADTVTRNPVDMPNFLLASMLSTELYKTLDLQTLFGKLIDDDKSSTQHYTLLSIIKNSERFQAVKQKYEELSNEPGSESQFRTLIEEASQCANDYIENVRASVENTLSERQLQSLTERSLQLEKKIEEVKKQKQAVEEKLEHYQKKEKGKKRYLRRYKKRRNSSEKKSK